MPKSAKVRNQKNKSTLAAYAANPRLAELIKAHHDYQKKLENFMFASEGKCCYLFPDWAHQLDEYAHQTKDTLIECAGKEVYRKVTGE